MPRHIKTVPEKFQTKLSKVPTDGRLSVTRNSIKVDNKVLLTFSDTQVKYTTTRYYESKKEDVIDEDFTVIILLDHDTLNLFSTSLYNPPRKCKTIIKLFSDENPQINSIVIGGSENKVDGNVVYIKYDTFHTFSLINNEEAVDKNVRIKARVQPFLQTDFNLEIEVPETNRNYSLLIDEAIASGKLSSEDIIKVTNQLGIGDATEIVIEQQITKQAEWLLNSMQEVVDEEELSKSKAQELGKRIFNIPKNQISGPEDLMEIILTKYGKNIIFGVPALLNVNSYIKSKQLGVSNSQIDIILINHLSDIEIVELKRSDKPLLEYDSNRGKFYISKDLAMAVSQCERYISAFYKDNDDQYTIGTKTIREFIIEEVGGAIELSICRPTSLVVMGSIQRITKPYEKLSTKAKSKISKAEYNANAERAYKELKSAYKNVQITTYTELIEGARLRLQQSE